MPADHKKTAFEVATDHHLLMKARYRFALITAVKRTIGVRQERHD
jgi:hypothetical protein